MKKITYIFLFLCQFSHFVLAQNKNETVAVMPFTAGKADAERALNLTGYVETAFSKSNRFTMIDRTSFPQVLAEDTLQRNPDLFESMAFEQSKKLGAKYLVTGRLSETSSGTKTEDDIKKEATKNMLGGWLGKTAGNAMGQATGSIPFSMKIVDVQTGKILKSESMIATSKAANSKNALAEAMQEAQKLIDDFIGKTFPTFAKYFKMIDDKKVKIVGGSKVGFQKNQLLKVVEVNQVEVDGEMLVEEIHLATLKIIEVENENFSIGKVETIHVKGTVINEAKFKQPNIFIKSGAEK